MAEDSWAGEERRLHERHAIVFPVEVQVAEPGAPMKKLVGVSMRVSRGGALISVDKQVREGARCRITFKQAAGRVAPATATGRVRRSGPGERGKQTIAVQFDELLETVKAPGEL